MSKTAICAQSSKTKVPSVTMVDVNAKNKPKNSKKKTFPAGSVQDYLYNNAKTDYEALKFSHNMFTMRIVEEEILFEVNDDLSRILYNEDITQNLNDEISSLDMILSSYNSDSYNIVAKHAHNLDMEDYDPTNANEQFALMCMFCLNFFKSKYDKINTLEDITRPIPTPFLINLLNRLKNLEVVFKAESIEYAGILKGVRINKTMFGVSLLVDIIMLSKNKDGYAQGIKRFVLPYRNLAEKVEDLGFSLITEEQKARLTERGKKYIRLNNKPAYMNCQGFGFVNGWMGDTRVTVDGRVMIDINAMRILNPEIDDNWYVASAFYDNTVQIQVVDEKSLWMCVPVVYGFSFSTKDWIKMHIADIYPITFSETAFDELIVPESHKKIFVSSLTNAMPSLDSIEGKGSGKIFLLYGPPGCGKTMTAESVAEYLKLPIYYVSVGELGISPEAMERSLNGVMQVAQSWNAVVLLDEVDVFAMKRTGSDIQRNAMTAILLRLLERYSGIMFMTTNLKDNLDPAFISRATATIPYKGLSISGRKTIWKSLLNKVEELGVVVDSAIIKDNLNKLANYDLNGREIKNHVRLSYSIAVGNDDRILTMEIIESIINLKTA